MIIEYKIDNGFKTDAIDGASDDTIMHLLILLNR